MAGFAAGLIGSYAKTLIDKHKAERDREDRSKEAELGLIQTAMNSGQLPPDQMKAAFERSEEIINEYTGKKSKGQFSLKNLIGQFPDTQQPKQQAQPGGTPTPAPASKPSVSLGQPPARAGAQASTATAQPSAGGVNLGAPPSRGTFNPTFRSPADVAYDIAKKQTKAKLDAEDDEKKKQFGAAMQEYMKDNPGATPAQALQYAGPIIGLKNPTHAHPISYKGANGDKMPGWQDENGQVYGQNGDAIPNAVLWTAPNKPTASDQKKEDIIAGYMKQGMTREQATARYEKESATQFTQKGQPTTTTTTTTAPSVAYDPVTGKAVTGPAITRETSTTRSKGGAHALGVGQGVLTANGTPKREPLPYALPKEAATAIRKAQDSYEDANSRYTVMKDTLAKIKNDPNMAAQGDILILSNHIGMTWSAQKGGRIPITIWNEARTARPWLQGIDVKIQGGFVTGAILTPQQRAQMIDLADEQRRVAQNRVLNEQVRYGLMVKVTPLKGPSAGTVGYVTKQYLAQHSADYKQIP